MAHSRTGPGDRTPLSLTEPGQVVSLARHATDLDAVAEQLRGMSSVGHRVVLLWWQGEPGPALRAFTSRVQLAEPPANGRRARVLRLGRSARTAVLHRGEDPFGRLLRADPRARRALQRADAVVPVGPDTWGLGDRLDTGGRPLVGPEELDRWGRLPELWRTVQRRGEKNFLPHDIRDAGPLLAELDELGVGVPQRHQPSLVRWVESLHGVGEYDLALGLVTHLDEDAPTDHPADPALRRGLRLLVRMSAEGSEQPGLQATVRALLQAADDVLAQKGTRRAEDTRRAVSATTLALQLLFHRELHADTLTSPLVEDPDGFLDDWRASRVGRLLAAPVPQHPVLRREGPAAASAGAGTPRDGGRPRVVVVPGSYPQFATPVIEALRERADVHVADLRARPDLRGLGTQAGLVGARLRLGLGQVWQPDLELVEEMEAADVVLVDWADRGALAAVMSVPDGVPLVLRMHSMDALSPWIHLLDWTRVHDLVLVSDHLRDLVVRLLGDRLSGTRVHVVPNVLDPRRLPTHKTEGHRRRLLMVGWAQRVKDPLWALEVLAELRAEDPTWRLTLVGTDFVPGSVRSQAGYAREFWERVASQDVRDGVDFVAYTRDLAPHLAAAGFVLSASRRESFGLGLVEGAATGAVPVVRDWPMFASLGGARGLFPDDWVVGTPAQAAARIRSLGGEPEWAAASAQARATVDARFAGDVSRSLMQELVLGRA